MNLQPTAGSLFSGIGGLDLAVCEFFGANLRWVCEHDPTQKHRQPAAEVLAHRFPDVPNLGDITQVDWSTVEPVDIICGGFPCQDISYAGKGAGIAEGTRSGLWFHFAAAVGSLRPIYVVVENVNALLSRGLGIVLGDLASLGFDAEWTSLRASEVGAPHRRERIFILAWHRERERERVGSCRHQRRRTSGQERCSRLSKHLGADTPWTSHEQSNDSCQLPWSRIPSEHSTEQRIGTADGGGYTETEAMTSERLLPTPVARDYKGSRHKISLPREIEKL